MRIAMVGSLFRSGIQRYKGMPHCGSIPTFSNNRHTRSIRMVHSTTQIDLPSSTEIRRGMMDLWPSIVKDLTEAEPYREIPDAMEWLKKLLEYNVPHSEKLRTLALVYSYCMLAPPEQVTEENLKRLMIVGWCHELNQTWTLVHDDIMDHSTIRRGQPCWYLLDDVGLRAINDGVLLIESAYHILSKHFKNEKYYVGLLETFHKMSMEIALGQVLDLSFSNGRDPPNLNLFTMDRYISLAKFKGAQYILFAPAKLAMYFAGITDFDRHRQALNLLIDMGYLYQAQDDYLDCYGDPNVCGEIGTDIQEGRCTWFAVTALEHATPSQKQIMQECYGRNDPEKVARIKQLYEDLGLSAMYKNYEEETYNLLCTRIQQISCGFPRELLLKFLSMMYRRDI